MPLEKSPLHGPVSRIVERADQCVQCGLCLPVCPTYALDRNEAESPRGRIAIAAVLARGAADPTAALRQHIDHCLGCLNCEKVRPAHVQYDELLIETRALLGPTPTRPGLLLSLLQRPALLRALRGIGARIALPHWKDAAARRLRPDSPWRAALSSLPATAPAPPLKPRRAHGTLPHLALFPGCVASVEDAEAQHGALRLLQAAGFQVSVLPAFCCGAMDLHGGETNRAEQAARRVHEAWQASGASQLITVTPGCLGTLRRALPGQSVVDPLELLANHAESLHFRPLAQRVAVHLPCTQINVADTEASLLRLLRRIPELEVLPMQRPPHCCSAAGSHLLEYPERAATLREASLLLLAALDPQLWLSSNIGCRLHLGSASAALPSQHPLSLLAQQLELA